MKRFLVCTVAVLAVLSFGMVLIHCGGGDDPKECETNEDCPQGYWCDRTVWECKEIDCIPNCTGKCGGDDGCDDTCPNNCPTGYECNMTTFLCEATGCNTNDDCTTTQCCKLGVCTDMDCGTLQCGNDPECGFLCGTCGAGTHCDMGTCVQDVACVDDGDCLGTECCIGVPLACQPMNCTGLECGPDSVCGKDCAACPAGEVCNAGVCEPGTVTGDCPAGQDCVDMTQGNGYYGCIIPPSTIPPGNQTGCDPANSIWCDGNYTCFQVDPDTVCVENCGTCTAPLTCQVVFPGGPWGCLGPNSSVPAGAPNCDAGPCAGNATCYSVGGTSTACVDNCSVGYGCTTEGATRCLGTTVQTCTNSAWVDTTDCSTSSQVCLNGACTAPAALGDFCENLACAAGLDCVGTTASVHSFCTPECDCDNQTGCDAGWECLLSDGGTPPTLRHRGRMPRRRRRRLHLRGSGHRPRRQRHLRLHGPVTPLLRLTFFDRCPNLFLCGFISR